MPVEGFKVDVEKAVGHQFPSEKVVCNRRDYLLYALDKDFSPLPTYPLVLQLKGNDYDVNVFKERAQGKGSLPGMPPYDPNKIVHGEQSLRVHKPFPVNGGTFTARKTCTGIYDKGSGMVIEMTIDLYDEQDKVQYCSMVSKSFVRGYGGWSGPKGPKATAYPPPKRHPDAIEVFATTPSQALIYRLSGDYNPLHADTALAPKIGFPKPILHGLCTYGACGHAIVKKLANNEPARFKSIEGRFASPVFPGETVEIYMWKVDDPDAKVQGVIFVAKVKERDVVVVNNGYATLHKNIPESKL
ncbi:MaoC like domain-containing protein [Mycotypha africana]|uniref:MaoC like domain-containing protein n=1 Tax=Mycotypha africana TaxID=64632 RepID=UPI002300E8C5|nr:MaoC like domain-containing protein [Mycotypha africana]KAI8967447.1 MaoC like domain-containing protein [Mycotypha africana]